MSQSSTAYVSLILLVAAVAGGRDAAIRVLLPGAFIGLATAWNACDTRKALQVGGLPLDACFAPLLICAAMLAVGLAALPLLVVTLLSSLGFFEPLYSSLQSTANGADHTRLHESDLDFDAPYGGDAPASDMTRQDSTAVQEEQQGASNAAASTAKSHALFAASIALVHPFWAVLLLHIHHLLCFVTGLERENVGRPSESSISVLPSVVGISSHATFVLAGMYYWEPTFHSAVVASVFMFLADAVGFWTHMVLTRPAAKVDSELFDHDTDDTERARREMLPITSLSATALLLVPAGSSSCFLFAVFGLVVGAAWICLKAFGAAQQPEASSIAIALAHIAGSAIIAATGVGSVTLTAATVSSVYALYFACRLQVQKAGPLLGEATANRSSFAHLHELLLSVTAAAMSLLLGGTCSLQAHVEAGDSLSWIAGGLLTILFAPFALVGFSSVQRDAVFFFAAYRGLANPLMIHTCSVLQLLVLAWMRPTTRACLLAATFNIAMTLLIAQRDVDGVTFTRRIQSAMKVWLTGLCSLPDAVEVTSPRDKRVSVLLSSCGSAIAGWSILSCYLCLATTSSSTYMPTAAVLGLAAYAMVGTALHRTHTLPGYDVTFSAIGLSAILWLFHRAHRANTFSTQHVPWLLWCADCIAVLWAIVFWLQRHAFNRNPSGFVSSAKDELLTAAPPTSHKAWIRLHRIVNAGQSVLLLLSLWLTVTSVTAFSSPPSLKELTPVPIMAGAIPLVVLCSMSRPKFDARRAVLLIGLLASVAQLIAALFDSFGRHLGAGSTAMLIVFQGSFFLAPPSSKWTTSSFAIWWLLHAAVAYFLCQMALSEVAALVATSSSLNLLCFRMSRQHFGFRAANQPCATGDEKQQAPERGPGLFWVSLLCIMMPVSGMLLAVGIDHPFNGGVGWFGALSLSAAAVVAAAFLLEPSHRSDFCPFPELSLALGCTVMTITVASSADILTGLITLFLTVPALAQAVSASALTWSGTGRSQAWPVSLQPSAFRADPAVLIPGMVAFVVLAPPVCHSALLANWIYVVSRNIVPTALISHGPRVFQQSV